MPGDKERFVLDRLREVEEILAGIGDGQGSHGTIRVTVEVYVFCTF